MLVGMIEFGPSGEGRDALSHSLIGLDLFLVRHSQFGWTCFMTVHSVCL